MDTSRESCLSDATNQSRFLRCYLVVGSAIAKGLAPSIGLHGQVRERDVRRIARRMNVAGQVRVARSEEWRRTCSATCHRTRPHSKLVAGREGSHLFSYSRIGVYTVKSHRIARAIAIAVWWALQAILRSGMTVNVIKRRILNVE